MSRGISPVLTNRPMVAYSVHNVPTTFDRDIANFSVPATLGVILGSFYYGYMVFQIPGGLLALKIGGARLYGLAVCTASIMTLLTPMAARWSPAGLITLRVLEGLVLVSTTVLSLFKYQRISLIDFFACFACLLIVSLFVSLFICSHQGVLFPCNHAIWSRWAPSGEKTALVTVSVTGKQIMTTTQSC